MELCTLPFSAIHLKFKIRMNMRKAESCRFEQTIKLHQM